MIAIRHSAKEALASARSRPERALPEVLPMPEDALERTEQARVAGLAVLAAGLVVAIVAIALYFVRSR